MSVFDLGPLGTGSASASVSAKPPAKSGTVAADILHEAAKIVEGDRNATHGDKERSFEMIADFWGTYLRDSNGVLRVALTGRDVAQMMVLMKVARANCGTPVRDHFVDQAGYSGIAGELK